MALAKHASANRLRIINIMNSHPISPHALYDCQQCGRAYYHEIEAAKWLIEPDVRYQETYQILVVRCPQHVTVWSLRCAGLGRSKKLIAQAETQKIKDSEFLPRPIGWNPYIDPIPLSLINPEGKEHDKIRKPRDYYYPQKL